MNNVTLPASYQPKAPFTVGGNTSKVYYSWMAAIKAAKYAQAPAVDAAGVTIWQPKEYVK